jgi:MFS family permease
MSVVGNLSPILFLTFRSLYGISYSLLGLLVLINFSTQLAIDLVFSFFSHKFNISKTVQNTPVIAVYGLLIYSLWPFIFPSKVYLGLVIGTIVAAAASGLAEVLISPVIAAIPSKNPDREMSKLHSIYAWGVVGMVIFSTIFLHIFGRASWQCLGLIFAVIPLVSAMLFRISKVPTLETPERVSGAIELLKNKTLWLCIFAIFIGGASECTMAQWSSGYLEQALNIPKVWGDIFGVALFATMLGLGRSLYAKIGKNIEQVLVLGVISATGCYFVSAVSNIPILGLLACGFTGFCVSMLWPGSLLIASARISTGGVFIYAMMAAGGDLGASVGPQLVGIITDLAMKSDYIVSLADNWGLTGEQLGMKCGMLTGMLFPLVGIIVFLYILKTRRKEQGEY